MISRPTDQAIIVVLELELLISAKTIVKFMGGKLIQRTSSTAGFQLYDRRHKQKLNHALLTFLPIITICTKLKGINTKTKTI
jgi:hypothetical protein